MTQSHSITSLTVAFATNLYRGTNNSIRMLYSALILRIMSSVATTIRGAAIAALAAALGLSLGTVALANRDGRWVSTWADPAVSTVQAPSNQTVREIERISLGGNWLRVRLRTNSIQLP